MNKSIKMVKGDKVASMYVKKAKELMSRADLKSSDNVPVFVSILCDSLAFFLQESGFEAAGREVLADLNEFRFRHSIECVVGPGRYEVTQSVHLDLNFYANILDVLHDVLHEDPEDEVEGADAVPPGFSEPRGPDLKRVSIYR